MTLDEYLYENSLTLREFAATLTAHAGRPVSISAVQKWAVGSRRPRWDMAAIIEKATGAKVPVSVWSTI